jgi:iron(III) transport system substrate-binding protein
VVAVVTLLLAAGLVAFALRPRLFSPGGPVINAYCAHDAIYADAIFQEFTRQTGIPVDVTYDTEATKSLSLVNKLKIEREHPHCDVFWNNEQLGMMDLAREGILEPYKGSGYERIPALYKDPDGRWSGFAARMRVWIVNTKEMPPVPEKIEALFNEHPDHCAIANPLYGTTLTQFSILWQLWGPARLKAWRADLRKRGLREMAGNAPVKDAVAEGVCEVGWTDTDDFFEALDEKKPVAMLPLFVSDSMLSSDISGSGKPGGDSKTADKNKKYTVIIPNTVALIRGGQHQFEAQALVDFLLSAQTEQTLARSRSRQIPLGPVDQDQLPSEVRDLAKWVPQGYDLRSLETARRECIEWLKSESQR